MKIFGYIYKNSTVYSYRKSLNYDYMLLKSNLYIHLLLFASPFSLLANRGVQSPITFTDLKCEYAVNPIAIDTHQPKFSWIAESKGRGGLQTSYQILVSENLENLDKNRGEVWDSGKVKSDNSVHVRYTGTALESGKKYFWKVKIWGENQNVSDWSAPATFEMGLLKEQDWEGKWIGERIFNNLSYGIGKRGKAVQLFGKDQPIKGRFHRLAKLEDGIAINVWIKLDSFTDDMQTVYRKEDGDATQLLSIGKKNGQKGIWFGLGINTVYEEDCAPLPEDFFDDKKWHMITVSFDRTAKRFYADGKEIKAITNLGLISPRGYATAYIGSNQNQKEFFTGGIDELTVYRNGLQVAEIDRLMEGSLKSMDLIGSWEFEGQLKSNFKHRSDPPGKAQLLRKEFAVTKNIKRAKVYFSGLGLSELYLNGDKVGEDVLTPAHTDYHKSVKYMTYDVTSKLSPGNNAIGVILGNGWYSATVLDYPECWSDKPQLLLQLNIEYEDGTFASISSDQSWKTTAAPIGENDIDFGEKYDARKEISGWCSPNFNDSSWTSAQEDDGPTGKLSSLIMPAMKVVETLKPIKLEEPEPGTYLFSFDQLFGGWAKLKMKGQRGDTVTLEYSTRLLKSGLLDDEPWPGEQERDDYILSGDPKGECYEPRFTYHPVQYVQVKGLKYKPLLNDLEGRIVQNDEDLSGDFDCSNELFNSIHDNVNRTLSNSLKGFLLDCLHREPYGYNEPASIGASLYTRKNMPRFWKKYATDIRFAARADGSVGDVIPAFPGKPRVPDVSQGSAYAMLVWYLYQSYGDIELIAEHYETIKKWVDYIREQMCEGEIVSSGWLGDHMVPGLAPGYERYRSDETPPSLSYTALYFRNAHIVSEMAQLLHKKEDADQYGALAESIKKAFNTKYFDYQNSRYSSRSQTAELLPLSLGLVPEGHTAKLLKGIEHTITVKNSGHLMVGHAGLSALVEALTSNGLGEVMFNIVNQKTYPGWGYMVEQGATTIWESWGRDFASVGGRRRADNMTMLAGVNEFFYRYLAGIQGPNFYGIDTMEPAYKAFYIKPYPLGDLKFAKAFVTTVRGEIGSSWKREHDSFTLEVKIPYNSEAFVSIPRLGMKNIVISEGGKTVWSENKSDEEGVVGISEGVNDGEYITFTVGSGQYIFQAKAH